MSDPWNAAVNQLTNTMIANAHTDTLARARVPALVTQALLALETASLEIANDPLFRENRAELTFDARQRLADDQASRDDRAKAIALLCALTITSDDCSGTPATSKG